MNSTRNPQPKHYRCVNGRYGHHRPYVVPVYDENVPQTITRIGFQR